MVSNPGEFSVKIPLSDDQSESTKKPSAGKSLGQFSDVLNIIKNLRFAGEVIINQNARKSDQAMRCGQKY